VLIGTVLIGTVLIGTVLIGTVLIGAVLIGPGPWPGLRCEDARLTGGLQQFPGEQQQLFAFGGQFSGPFGVPGQQPVGEDGGPDRLAQGEVR
jgi:hypothetical protein